MSASTEHAVELKEWDFYQHFGGTWVDPLDFLIDDPTFGFGKPLLPLSLVDDRRHGRNRPIFQTEAQLAMIRGASRIVAQTAPMAIGAVDALCNYVIGKGFVYEAAARPGRTAPAGLAVAVQDVVDQFCDLNDWVGDRERELHLRVRRDGECFIGVYAILRGEVCLHRGAVLETGVCNACGMRGQPFDVYACDLHGKCMTRRFRNDRPGVRVCLACDDFASADQAAPKD